MQPEETLNTEQIGTPQRPTFSEEFLQVWVALPEKALFLVLLAGLLAIFQFLGNCQFNFTTSSSLFLWMWGAWNTEALDCSHGPLIPIIILALLWYKRQELLASVQGVWWPALWLLGGALLVHLVGYMIQQPRVSIIGLFLGLYSLAGIAWGWKTMKTSFFPFILFLFCMPLGTFIEKLTLSLRILATIITAFISNDLLGIPVVRDGTKLTDAVNAVYKYDVGVACSGIRSIFGLLAITTIFAMVLFKKPWKRVLIISFAIPLAIFCNVLRLTAIIMGAKVYGAAAGNFVHEWFGFITYAISIAAVMVMAHFLREKDAVSTASLGSSEKPSASIV